MPEKTPPREAIEEITRRAFDAGGSAVAKQARIEATKAAIRADRKKKG